MVMRSELWASVLPDYAGYVTTRHVQAAVKAGPAAVATAR